MHHSRNENLKHLTAVQLSAEHGYLEKWFRELTKRAATGDSRECDDIWNAFTAQLESHMAFEEREVFPLYARSSDSSAAVVQSLLADHAALRDQIQTLGIDLQLHLTSPATINAFIASLRDHAQRENQTLYAWLAAKNERDSAPASIGTAP